MYTVRLYCTHKVTTHTNLHIATYGQTHSIIVVVVVVVVILVVCSTTVTINFKTCCDNVSKCIYYIHILMNFSNGILWETYKPNSRLSYKRDFLHVLLLLIYCFAYEYYICILKVENVAPSTHTDDNNQVPTNLYLFGLDNYE